MHAYPQKNSDSFTKHFFHVIFLGNFSAQGLGCYFEILLRVKSISTIAINALLMSFPVVKKNAYE